MLLNRSLSRETDMYNGELYIEGFLQHLAPVSLCQRGLLVCRPTPLVALFFTDEIFDQCKPMFSWDAFWSLIFLALLVEQKLN